MSLTGRIRQRMKASGRRSASAHGLDVDSPVYLANIQGGARTMKFLKQLGFLGLAGAASGGRGGRGAGTGVGAGPRSESDSEVSNAVPAWSGRPTGRVRSVAGQVLMLDIGGHDMKFVADENTDVDRQGRPRNADCRRRSAHDRSRARRRHSARGARESNGSMRALEIQVKAQKTIAAR